MKRMCTRYGFIMVGLVLSGLFANAMAAELPAESDHPPTFTSPETDRAGTASSGEARSEEARLRQNSPLFEARVEELLDVEVLDAAGQSLGTVESVARSRLDHSLQLIVASGGRLGFGEKHMALPVENVRLVGSRLRLEQGLDEDQVEQFQASYNAKDYDEVDEQEREETLAQISHQ